MVERHIRLNETEDVKEFVNEAAKCDFDIDISYNLSLFLFQILFKYDRIPLEKITKICAIEIQNYEIY